MKIGPLMIGWRPIDDRERIELGLEPWLPGWEGFTVNWNGRGMMIVARPREGVEL